MVPHGQTHPIITALHECTNELERKLLDLDRDAQIVSDTGKESIAKERARIQAQIDELTGTVGRITAIISGESLSDDNRDGFLRLKPGQYRGIPKLVSAVQSYLSHCDPPGRPVPVTELVKQLNIGGFTVLMGRSKTPNKRRPVEPRDIRVMAANDMHEKEPREDGFVYGQTFRTHKKLDLIGLSLRAGSAMAVMEEPGRKDNF